MRPGCPTWSSTGISSRLRTRGRPKPPQAPCSSSWRSEQMSARKVARQFFDHMQAADVDEILCMVTPDAAVSLAPLQVHGSMVAEGAAYLYEMGSCDAARPRNAERLEQGATDEGGYRNEAFGVGGRQGLLPGEAQV